LGFMPSEKAPVSECHRHNDRGDVPPGRVAWVSLLHKTFGENAEMPYK
jgi:hypothetical protein